jgi:hypothetical protein
VIASGVAVVVARQNNAQAQEQARLGRRHELSQLIRTERRILYAHFLASHTSLLRHISAHDDIRQELMEQVELLTVAAQEIHLIGSAETARQALRLIDYYLESLGTSGLSRETIVKSAHIIRSLTASMKADLSSDDSGAR